MDSSEREKYLSVFRDAVTDDDIIKVTRAMLRSAAEGDAKAATVLRTVKAKRPDLYEQAEAAGPAFFFVCVAGVEIVAPGDTTREAALAACPSACVEADKTYCGQLPRRRLCRIKDADAP